MTTTELLAAQIAEMREDRDRWRAQAERLAEALEKMQGAATMPVRAPATPKTEDDLLMGVPAIAAAFRWNVRQTYYLKETHGLPTFKIGRIVCARRPDIAAWIAARGDAALISSKGGL